MKLLKHRKTYKNKINIASLVDVVFLLIIFFMTVSHITATEQLPINLPDAQNGNAPSQTSDENVIINIDSSGNIHLESTPIELTALKSKLEKLSNTTNISVTIRCDRNLEWSKVRAVIKTCRDCKITSLKVRVRDVSGE